MYLNTYETEAPEFESTNSAKEWFGNFSGVQIWHATRLLDPNTLLNEGLRIPNKKHLDEKLIDWIKANKTWYEKNIDSVVHNQQLARGEDPAVYGVLDKRDLSLNGINHYKEFGSEYWQSLMNKLFSFGYGSGRSELINYGRPYIVGINLLWESLEPNAVRGIVDAISKNDTSNFGVAVFRDVSPNEIFTIEPC